MSTTSSSGVVPSAARDGDGVVLPLAVEELLRGRDVEDREGRGPDRLDVSVLRDPDDLEVLLRLERRDLDRLAEREVLAVGRAGVDDDLSVALGPAALEQVERVEARVLGRGVDPEPEARGAVRVHRLAVVGDDLRVELVVDAAHRQPDGVEPADVVEERRLDRRWGRLLEVRGEARLLAADDGVRARVGVGEDAREGLVDRVREDVRPADHRDAEHDRERGQDRAELASREGS